MKRKYKKIDPVKRFWDKVNILSKDECWEWTASLSKKGYGQFWYKGKLIKAHRFSWELYNKRKLPKGKQSLHNCDNPTCVNPKHLYCGTNQDNSNDRIARNKRDYYGGLTTKLYSGEIWLIKKLNIPKGNKNRHLFSSYFIAKMFKVNKSMIIRIWNSEKFCCKEGYYV